TFRRKPRKLAAVEPSLLNEFELAAQVGVEGHEAKPSRHAVVLLRQAARELGSISAAPAHDAMQVRVVQPLLTGVTEHVARIGAANMRAEWAFEPIGITFAKVEIVQTGDRRS